jgi:DNA-binding MarR family transcriptional regulator
VQHNTNSASEAPVENPGVGEVLDFMRLVWAVDSGLQAVSGEMASMFEVSGVERLVLRVLSKYPAVCASELSEILGMSRASLVAPIKSLEDSGYVERIADPEDRRRALLKVTRTGARVSEAVASTVEAAVRKVLSNATSRTVDSAKTLLSALAAELNPDTLRPKSKA